MNHIIKHWLQTKIFNAVIFIKEEKKKQKIDAIISSMKRIGRTPLLSSDICIFGMEYMEFGDNFYCGKNAWIEALNNYHGQKFSPLLKIGDNFSMQHNCHIGCIEKIEIGNNVLLGSKVFITDHFHGNITALDINVPPIERPLSSKSVIIGDNVWIGDSVSILPGVKLGNNVIVGANAVVTKSFPDNAVIAGCPAKIVKMLSQI